MYITHRDVETQEAYRREMMRQAEPWHLLHTKRRVTNFIVARFHGLMLRIGIRLEDLGCRIKARYGAASEPVFSNPAEKGLQGC